jgi:hypothetical protein
MDPMLALSFRITLVLISSWAAFWAEKRLDAANLLHCTRQAVSRTLDQYNFFGPCRDQHSPEHASYCSSIRLAGLAKQPHCSAEAVPSTIVDHRRRTWISSFVCLLWTRWRRMGRLDGAHVSLKLIGMHDRPLTTSAERNEGFEMRQGLCLFYDLLGGLDIHCNGLHAHELTRDVGICRHPLSRRSS